MMAAHVHKFDRWIGAPCECGITAAEAIAALESQIAALRSKDSDLARIETLRQMLQRTLVGGDPWAVAQRLIVEVTDRQNRLGDLVRQHEFCQWDGIVGEHCMHCEAKEGNPQHSPDCAWLKATQ